MAQFKLRENILQGSGLKITSQSLGSVQQLESEGIYHRKERDSERVPNLVYKFCPRLWLTPISHMHGKTASNPAKAERNEKISADAHSRGEKVCSLSSAKLLPAYKNR